MVIHISYILVACTPTTSLDPALGGRRKQGTVGRRMQQGYMICVNICIGNLSLFLILPHVLPPSDWPFDTRAHIAARLDQKIGSSDKEVLESSFFQSC